MQGPVTEDAVEERPEAGGSVRIPDDWRVVRGLLKVALAIATCVVVTSLYPPVWKLLPSGPSIRWFALLAAVAPLGIFAAGVLIAIKKRRWRWMRPVGVGLMAAGIYEFGFVVFFGVVILLRQAGSS